MAQRQRKIKPALKRLLIDESGGKCANPGCSNWRVHIHHIKHWAVYKTHDSAHMIAICPSCHDAAHHGSLEITDEEIYQWKGIRRAVVPDSAHIFVEPASELKLLTGSLCISTTNDQLVVFELSNTNQMQFRVLDKNILQLSVHLQDQHGKELLRVVENHVRVVRNKGVIFDYRPGRARILLPATSDFVPRWLITQVRVQNPAFAADGRIVALDIGVLKPGLLRVQGCWPDRNTGVVITEWALSFCTKGLREPVSLVGAGETTELKYTGPVTNASFGFKAPPTEAAELNRRDPLQVGR